MPAPTRPYGLVLHSLVRDVPRMTVVNALPAVTAATRHLHVVMLTELIVVMTAVMLLRVMLFNFLVAMVMMGSQVVHMDVTPLRVAFDMPRRGELVMLVDRILTHVDLLVRAYRPLYA